MRAPLLAAALLTAAWAGAPAWAAPALAQDTLTPGTGSGATAPAADDAPPAMDEGAPVPTSPTATGALAPSEPDSAEEIVESDPDLWIGKPIVSADGVEIGTVDAVETDAAGAPQAVTTSIGGFLGFGASTVQLPVNPSYFDGEKVRVGLVETDINALAAEEPDTPAGAGLSTSADELK
ncbi:PRC-barrel domain-containing protein [Chthonobacter rhizosphaerae]|uniref:PRC-barrel domain-containing protein n=1 Tax=Chthonobacter rhizosphaerae TaxID=2735553 RepID=UPI0015EF8B50|nr:PRC-barrel domain-containing protein [Chthonobacter rhizosphaerae]